MLCNSLALKATVLHHTQMAVGTHVEGLGLTPVAAQPAYGGGVPGSVCGLDGMLTYGGSTRSEDTQIGLVP